MRKYEDCQWLSQWETQVGSLSIDLSKHDIAALSVTPLFVSFGGLSTMCRYPYRLGHGYPNSDQSTLVGNESLEPSRNPHHQSKAGMTSIENVSKISVHPISDIYESLIGPSSAKQLP